MPLTRFIDSLSTLRSSETLAGPDLLRGSPPLSEMDQAADHNRDYHSLPKVSYIGIQVRHSTGLTCGGRAAAIRAPRAKNSVLTVIRPHARRKKSFAKEGKPVD